MRAQDDATWEELALDRALQRVEVSGATELDELQELATERLELDPERWHSLRSRATHRLLFTTTGAGTSLADLARARSWAKRGGVSLAWLARNGRSWSAAPTAELFQFAAFLYETGVEIDPESEVVFRALFELAEPEYVPIASQVLVEYLLGSGNDDACREVLEESHARTGDLRLAGDVSVLMIDLMESRVAMRKGRTAEAKWLALQVVRELAELDPDEQVAYAGLIIGARVCVADCELDLGENEAVVRGNDALLSRDELFPVDDPREQLELQIAMALVQSDDAAEDEHERAREILQELAATASDLYRKVLAHSLLGVLSFGRGEPGEAFEFARRAEALEREATYTTPLEDRALRLAVGLRGLRLGSEGWRGRDESDVGGSPEEGVERWREELEAAIEELCSAWAGEQHDVGGEANWLDFRARFAITELLAQLAEQDRAEAAVELLARIQSTSRLSKKLGAGPVSVEEVREYLTTDERGVLLLFFGWDTTISIALDAETVRFEGTSRPFRVIDRSRPYVSALRQPPTRATSDRGRELERNGALLSETLFPESVRERLATWDEALVVGGDVLTGGTVGALPVLSERPLSVDLALSHVPSLGLAVELARRAELLDSANSLSVVAIEAEHGEDLPASARSMKPIRLSRDQLEGLVETLPGAKKVLRGGAATWSGAVRASERAKLLVLFTHGLWESGSPVPAAFLLSPESSGTGSIGWSDVAASGVPPWVVLATCGSGVGESRIGDEGASDLRGAFVEAGALGVVHTFGNVDQVATHALLVEVHRGLAEGLGLARALQRARAELWEREEYRDPYFVALVQLFGIGDRPIFETGG